mgnify:CR=1 FL=1
MERQIINTNIRLDLNRPDDLQAWTYLQNMDRKQYKSYTRAVVAALNDHFSRKERQEDDPYLETREKEDAFLQKVEDAIQRGIEKAKPVIQIVTASTTTSEMQAEGNPNEEEPQVSPLDFLEQLGL